MFHIRTTYRVSSFHVSFKPVAKLASPSTPEYIRRGLLAELVGEKV